MQNIPMIHILLIGILIILTVYIIILFNNLVALRNNVKKSWANIDVLLKQRHDELPKLIQTCQEYMKYEQPTLEKITEARTNAMTARARGDIEALGMAEGILKQSLGTLFAVAENYPDLKANETFNHLQNRISNLENSIADRRELYNENVTLNNTRIEQFPDILVAKIFSFKHFTTLEFSASELADITIKDHFRPHS